MSSVAVIILNYNTANLLELLLPSVLATSYKNLQIIVADNGSTDFSADVVAKFKTIIWMPLGSNFGYAEGYNRAINAVETDFVVLLNSDVKVTPNWLNPLVEYAIQNNYSALQPKILDFKNRNYFEYAGAAGGFMDYLGYPFCRGRIFDTCEEDLGQYNNAQDIFWASGAALFINRTDYLAAGGLDAKLFAHMEEIDLCWRLQMMGKKIACVPQSTVYHIGGGTLNAQNAKKTYLNFRNSLVLLARYNKGLEGFFKVFLRMVLDAPAAILFLSKGRFKDVWAIVKAHWHFLGKYKYWLEIPGFEPAVSQKPTGYYTKSIVWQYYAKNKKKFSDLN